MTKILNLRTNEFLVFLSSTEYDIRNKVVHKYIVTLEDSFQFATQKLSTIQIIRKYCRDYPRLKYVEEEFEVVYD